MEDSEPTYSSAAGSCLIKYPGSNPLPISASVGASPSSIGANRWRHAFKKIRATSYVLDPWGDFDLDAAVTMEAIRHRYSALKKKWINDKIFVKLEEKPFNRGAMRECFRLKKAPENGDWFSASNYVAKRYLLPVNSSVYLDDVRLQMEAKRWSEAFNKQNPPKKVDVFQMSVIEVLHEAAKSPAPNGDAKRRGSFALMNAPPLPSITTPTSHFYHIERYMDGEYRKYNSNSGFVDDQLRNTPQAFSHFTFERSGHRLLVVDIQGVGDLYTDPQIHTADGLGYNDGNLGLRGMALFFHSHRCNPLCAFLGLTPFDLSVGEVAELFEGSVSIEDGADEEDYEEDEDDGVFGPMSPPSTSNAGHPLPHLIDVKRRQQKQAHAASATQGESLFPLRKRSLSFGMIPETASSALSACYRSNSKHLYGPTVSRDEEYGRLTPSACSYTTPTNTHRMRTFSGSAAVGGAAKALPVAPMNMSQRQRSSSTDQSEEWEIEVEADNEELSPLFDALFNVESEFAWETEAGVQQAAFRQCTRRTRTFSESSDVDFLEPAGCGVATSGCTAPLHQAPHETQKPASAAHPSNLDQEIGQSILGQLHHELARLHEAGRFAKRLACGWSQNGLGGLALDDAEAGDGQPEVVVTAHSVDWESVLFHERLSAQLGCLEALIIMAHYYLGLPTQLLSDCPIKPREEDLGLGVDYLWRSSEGGDRRCMILLARYMDASVIFDAPSPCPLFSLVDRDHLKKVLNLRITPAEDFLVLVSTHTNGFPVPPPGSAAGTASVSSTASRRLWTEAVDWYRRAIENAGCSVPGSSPNGDSGATADEEGCADAEGRYDAAEDLSPVHRLLARLAEMYEVGGHGLEADPNMACELYTEAAESAIQMANGRLASRYFELADEVYAQAEELEAEGVVED